MTYPCTGSCRVEDFEGFWPSTTVQAAAISRVCGRRAHQSSKYYRRMALPSQLSSEPPPRFLKAAIKSEEPTTREGQFWLDYTCAEKTVTELDDVVSSHFRQIPFHHWIQLALGYREDAVNDILISVSMMGHIYRNSASRGRHGDEDGTESNENESLNPLTHYILENNQDGRLPIESLDHLLEPIRRVLENKNLHQNYHELIILGVRFEATYILPEKVDWSTRLSTTFSLYHQLLNNSTEDLAWAMTRRDVHFFKTLDASLLECGAGAFLDKKWLSLSNEAFECALACPHLESVMSDLVMKLYECRNFNSMTAILLGLKHSCASRLRSSLVALLELLDGENNFEFYRNQAVECAALPWLLPFRRHFRRASLFKNRAESILAASNLILQIHLYCDKYLAGDLNLGQ